MVSRTTTALFLAALLILPASGECAAAAGEGRDRIVAESIGDIPNHPEDTPEEAVARAVARAGKDYHAQAEILAGIAWPTGPMDPALSKVARRILVEYGADGMRALRKSIRRAGPGYSGDVVLALTQAYEYVQSGIPQDYLPAMLDALWDGSADARRLAMLTLTRHGENSGILPMMDSAYEYPELTTTVIECLGRLRDERARFFLDSHLRSDDIAIRQAAATSLAQIGGIALEMLVRGIREEDDHLRQLSAIALSTVAGPDELTALHEYVGAFPEDDPAAVGAVRRRAEYIERMIEAYHNLQQDQDGPEN
jgi:hypothetical protein